MRTARKRQTTTITDDNDDDDDNNKVEEDERNRVCAPIKTDDFSEIGKKETKIRYYVVKRR